MKKIVLIYISLISLFLLTSCLGTPYSWHIPKTNSEWDGNYIYYKNMVSKTNGDDEVKLFDSFTYEETTYNDLYFLDHVFIDNILYACVSVNNYKNDAILKYNLENDTLSIIYFSKESTLKSIISYSPSSLIVEDKKIIKIDLITNEISYIDSTESNEQPDGNLKKEEKRVYIEYKGYTYEFTNDSFWQGDGIFYCYYLNRKNEIEKKFEIIQFYCTHPDHSMDEFKSSTFLAACSKDNNPDRIMISNYII